MDADRIERALREGPPDEPTYVPGAFRQRRRVPVLFLQAGAVLAAAVIMGVVAGVTLNVLREPSGSVGGPVDAEQLAAEIEGRWSSGEIGREAWIDRLTALGHRRADIDFALSNLPDHERVRYDLVFEDDHLMIYGSFDGADLRPMSGGPYEVLDNGALYYDDVACFITVRFDLDGHRLDFEPMQTEGCSADESLNNAAFFNLLSYTRSSGGPPP
jgi:hypothetical protein